MDSAYQRADTQLIADAVQHLVELPQGQRPPRTVVGPIFTEGIAEYNETYERVKAQLAQSLGRPDQAIPWVVEIPSIVPSPAANVLNAT